MFDLDITHIVVYCPKVCHDLDDLRSYLTFDLTSMTYCLLITQTSRIISVSVSP